MRLKGAIDPRITYSPTYMAWDAAVAVGATLDELQKLYSGQYSPEFLGHVVAFAGTRKAIENHVQDAVARKSQSGKKGGRRRKR